MAALNNLHAFHGAVWAIGNTMRMDPLPPGETRANLDIQKQYQDAKDAITSELKAKDADGNIIEDPEDTSKSRSWFSYMTFGLFD